MCVSVSVCSCSCACVCFCVPSSSALAFRLINSRLTGWLADWLTDQITTRTRLFRNSAFLPPVLCVVWCSSLTSTVLVLLLLLFYLAVVAFSGPFLLLLTNLNLSLTRFTLLWLFSEPLPFPSLPPPLTTADIAPLRQTDHTLNTLSHYSLFLSCLFLLLLLFAMSQQKLWEWGGGTRCVVLFGSLVELKWYHHHHPKHLGVFLPAILQTGDTICVYACCCCRSISCICKRFRSSRASLSVIRRNN